ncbi:MAG: dipeptide epimerase, partial [Gemmatimonadetes bacterium]|nr:dipeptide epimerase [Gemmatimonadota bacterium]
MEMTLRLENWMLKRPFSTARFSITQNTALTVELRDGELAGRGECEPHEHDADIATGVVRSIEQIRGPIESGLTRQQLDRLLPAGPARNAIDCALWDLEAKRAGRRAWELAGVALSAPLTTAYTISLAGPAEMAAEAKRHRDRPLLKVKLGRQESLAIVEAVRRAAPDARLIVDVNEAWTIDDLNRLAGPLSTLGVELIEQPLPAGDDAGLRAYRGSIPLCADESCTD